LRANLRVRQDSLAVGGNVPAGGTLWRFCGETREAFVMESQHSDSFNSERPDSPNNAAIAAEISFSHFLSYC
jgi:hypothetical protein